MGLSQNNQNSASAARSLRSRPCLRKGCESLYEPTRWNQRYCQDPDCRREVRRWQATKRQQAHRRLPENRRKHAEAEAKRRQAQATCPGPDRVPSDHGPGSTQVIEAWSRGKEKSADFCDRPGCYEPVPGDSRAPARYCEADCRKAVRRVQDRERKWLSRKGYSSTSEPFVVAPGTAECFGAQQVAPRNGGVGQQTKAVGNYRDDQQRTLSWHAIEDSTLTPLPDRGDQQDDCSEEDSRAKPRPPPR